MRKVLFWLHLTTGTIAGIVILLMSITGVLLMYERQMIAWADRTHRSTPPSAKAQRLGPEALIHAALSAKPGLPASVTLQADPGAPAEIAYGRNDIAYLDVYTGRLVGEGSRGIRAFFQTVTELHRYLALKDASRATGRAITGACNLAFLFLVMTGMYLWLPRKWNWNAARAVLFFRRGLSGKPRDFNWHNVIGIWCAVPLFLVVLGALVISYSWATNLVYTITGTQPPNAPALAPNMNSAVPRQQFAGLDRAWAIAEQQTPDWQSISLRYPASHQAPYVFTIAGSHRGRPDKRSSLSIHRHSGEILQSENFASYNLGRKVRSWLRFIHTGEALGVAGQTLAGVVSAGGAVLVWTGLALSWRRFRTWRERKRDRPNEFAPAA